MRAIVSDYHLRATRQLSQALELLSTGEGWRPIAGGTDLMVLFNAGKLPYRGLVSISQIPELKQIETTPDHVVIGGAVTYTEIRDNALLRQDFPLLGQAASWTGGIANQNRGTLAGNIANGSPAADSPPILLVYDAELELASLRDRRTIPYRDFHVGYKQMQMRPDEIIASIRLPRRAGRVRQYARKVGTRKAQAISKASLAAVADENDGLLEDVRIAVGSVAEMPIRCVETEKFLQTGKITEVSIAAAKRMILSEIRPISDIRSTVRYRAHVTANLLGEFLESIG